MSIYEAKGIRIQEDLELISVLIWAVGSEEAPRVRRDLRRWILPLGYNIGETDKASQVNPSLSLPRLSPVPGRGFVCVREVLVHP